MSAWLVPTSVAVVITLIVLIVQIARWAGSVNTNIETLKDVTMELRADMKELATEFRTEMREFRMEMREVRTEMREVRTEMREVRAESRDTRTNLHALIQSLGGPATMAESPIRLTKYGETIAQEFDAPTWAVAAADHLYSTTDGKPEWKVYEQCVRYVQDQMNDEATADRMKEVAYNKGITVAKVHTVLAVVLRDRLLALRAEDAVVECAPAGES